MFLVAVGQVGQLPMAVVERRELERVVRLLFAHALKTSGEVLAFHW